MKRRFIPVLAALGLTLAAFPARAQTGTVLPSSQFDTSDFPQWGKDLRRAEVIAFGIFPFTMFTATFFMDTWRTYNHDWDTRYAPWPFKTAGAVDMTVKEHEITLAAAGIAALTLALTDFVIVRVKRYQAQQRMLRLPEGSPIIIKRPWPENAAEGQEPSGDTAESSGMAENPVTP
jgi:hypothetical protein